MFEILVQICQILGVEYDRDYLKELSDCEKMGYLLNQIYKFLGGK